MALRAERWEYRLSLSHVDRELSIEKNLVLGRHPSETTQHLTLRVLGWSLLYDERLEFGPGLSAGDAPDLVVHDLTGRLTQWIACGDADAELVRKVVQHNRDATAHVVFGDRGRFDDFHAQVASWGRLPRGWDAVSTWLIDPALVAALGQREQLRQRWSVTIVGDHIYLEAEGETYDGAITRGLTPAQQ